MLMTERLLFFIESLLSWIVLVVVIGESCTYNLILYLFLTHETRNLRLPVTVSTYLSITYIQKVTVDGVTCPAF
jgi:hypothetical protein